MRRKRVPGGRTELNPMFKDIDMFKKISKGNGDFREGPTQLNFQFNNGIRKQYRARCSGAHR